jgi:peptidoglycan/xylan/chitin deacetylase (PgdA/CDA1 family)
MLERHLDWIGRRYRFVDLDELGSCLETNHESNSRIAAITFDDGYQDFYDHALPLLRRKGIPAAVFVVTDYATNGRVPLHDKLYLLLNRRVRRPLHRVVGVAIPDISAMNAYDAMRALLEALPLDKLELLVGAWESENPISEQLLADFRPLSWETLERIHRSGVTIGSHTRSHILLTNETQPRLNGEVIGSRKEIQRRLPGNEVKHFAYPSGQFNEASVNAVATAGYRFGYTSCSHRSSLHPFLTVPRTLLWEKSSLDSHSSFSGEVLDCQIHHAFAWTEDCRQGHELNRVGA